MDPEAVQTSGRQVAALEPHAQATVQRLLTGYTTAAGSVVHAKVGAAMNRFHDSHAKTHRSVPHAVAQLGFTTASGGKVIADASNESTAVQMSSLATQQAELGTLRRPLDC